MTNQVVILCKIAIFVLICLIGYILFTLWGNNDDRNVPQPLRERYLKFKGKEKPALDDRGNISLALGELYDRLEQVTADYFCQNWAQFGPFHIDNPTVMVVAHHDPDRLQYLIVSLAQVHNIQSILLVFSHSYYDERVDDLIKTIDFCLVKQIYYPNSVQLFPTTFPGMDGDDCTYTENGTSSRLRSFCAHRDSRLTEGKHHWWWTAHTIFEHRWPWFKGHRGMVMFIREDSYVLPDLLHMMSFAQRALAHVPEAEMISFGRPLSNNMEYDKLSISIWKPMYENGLAFNKSMWEKIRSQSSRFCEYDDTSWSYSMQAVFGGAWSGGRAVTVASSAARVLSTGVYRSGRAALAALGPRLRAATTAGLTFPRDVHAVLLYDTEGIKFDYFKLPPRGNGGWTDYRDRNLCLEPLMTTNTDDDSTTTPPIFDTIKTNPGRP